MLRFGNSGGKALGSLGSFISTNDGRTSERFNVERGVHISRNGGSSQENRRTIALAKTAMTKLNKFWKDRHITTTTKCKLVNTLVFPIALYAAETWILKATNIARLDVFEMWVWRRFSGQTAELTYPYSKNLTSKSDN